MNDNISCFKVILLAVSEYESMRSKQETITGVLALGEIGLCIYEMKD